MPEVNPTRDTSSGFGRCARSASFGRSFFGAPAIAVANVRVDGTLDLQHDHHTDGRGLDLERATLYRRIEERVERIAQELGTTNRKVNALENFVIPDMKAIIKFIEDKLDEESMEELVRTKLIGGAKASRR